MVFKVLPAIQPRFFFCKLCAFLKPSICVFSFFRNVLLFSFRRPNMVCLSMTSMVDLRVPMFVQLGFTRIIEFSDVFLSFG